MDASTKGGDLVDALFSENSEYAVEDSRDLRRIEALPRRTAPIAAPATLQMLADALTRRFRRERTTPCACASRGRPCITAFRGVQAAVLTEAPLMGGSLGSILVGGGKTGVDIFLPMVMSSKVAILLLPNALLRQFHEQDFPAWSEHFHTPILAGSAPPWSVKLPVLHVLAYSRLSSPAATNFFERINPDLIIADEPQYLKNVLTARGSRFKRYLEAHPHVRFCAHSGTLTVRSIRDYAHMSAFALRQGSPLPLDSDTVKDWSKALDPSPCPAPMGALARLCREGEHVRSGFRRRFIETPGVIATEDSELPTKLEFRERKAPPIPDEIKKALSKIRNSDERPDGQIFMDKLTKSMCLRQLGCGFYYRAKFPRGEAPKLIEAWLATRKAWQVEIRDFLKYEGRTGMDSPKLLGKAASRWYNGYAWLDAKGTRHKCEPKTKDGPYPVWESLMWREWHEIREQVQPEKDTVWLSDYLVKDAAQWALESPGIVWYPHDAFGRAVADLAGIRCYGPSDDGNPEITEKGDRSAVCSISSHGTGKNLQFAYSRNLVANAPSGGGVWEQMIGRTHRPGQPRAMVQVEYYAHTSEMASAIEKAKEEALYAEQTLWSKQKLCYGVWL